MRARDPQCTRFGPGAALLGALLLALPALAETVLVGDRDGFTGPPDATGIYVRPEFDAYISWPSGNNCSYHNCQVRPFDTNGTTNWNFGHSFVNLPPIASATLEIHVRGGQGPGNDAIALQYINIGDPNNPLERIWGWAAGFAYLETVPGAISDGDGVWQYQDELTIVLDLSALPRPDGTTVDLLPMINADGYLDVHIADDTDVDYIELNYTRAFFGLPHEALGQAVLDFGPLDPNDPGSPQVLTVSNLGSSGNDGVAVLTCNGCGPWGPTGGAVRIIPCWFINGGTSNPSIALNVAGQGFASHGIRFYSTDANQPVRVRAQFDLGADSTTTPIEFRVLSGGTVVHSETGFQTPQCPGGGVPPACTDPVLLSPCALIDTVAWRYFGSPHSLGGFGWEVRFASSETLTMPSGTVVSGDVLRIFFVPVVQIGDPAIGYFTITGSSDSPGGLALTIAGEAVQLFGLFEQTLGQAQFRFGALDPNDPNSPTTMTVWNIGDSGQDGVQIDLDQAASATLLWSDLAPNVSGAWLELGVAGSVGGATQDLGTTRVTDTGGSLEVTVADFGAFQSIAVFNNGQIVSSANGHIGPIATVSDWPTGAMVPTPTTNPFCPPIDCPTVTVAWTWSSPVTIEVPGSAPVVGDTLVIANPQATAPSSLATATLRAAGIPSITLEDIVVPVPCPGDLNADSTVDLTDLSILLNNFGTTGAGPGDGDIDGDADVDLTDLSILLSNFGTPCT